MIAIPHRGVLTLLTAFEIYQGHKDIVSEPVLLPYGPDPVVIAYEYDAGDGFPSPSPSAPSPSLSPSPSIPGYSPLATQAADTARIEVSADGEFWIPIDVTASGTARGFFTTTLVPNVAKWVRVRLSAPSSHDRTVWTLQLWHSRIGSGDQ